MRAYLKAMTGHVGSAAVDVLFVAFLSLLPLLLGRIASVVNDHLRTEDYWSFLYNGQLAFYSMSSLSTLLIICFRQKLPPKATLLIGFLSVVCFSFLIVLVGADPSLQRGQAFFGALAVYLYAGVLILRILTDAMKAVGTGDALEAGSKRAAAVKSELAERMGKSA